MSQKTSDTLKRLYKSLKVTQNRLDELEACQHSDIAVIGMACRFPGGADSPEKYWDIIKQGVDTAREVPAQRWQADKFLNEVDREAAGKMYSAVGGFLDEDLSLFDSRFFQISPKEAESLDPQHRMLLEVSWEALENAGLDISRLSGSKTGVFVGVSNSDYFAANLRSGDLDRINAYAVTGGTFSMATGRLAYFYDFVGPNMAIDTACSSSLVSTHLACQSLRSGESDMVLSGGVNLVLTPEVHISFSKLNALSPTGRCKSFDADGDGHSRGDGCGLLVMKRLKDALRDNDPVLAVIKGGAIAQDGKSNGLTAPNGLAQQNTMRMALASARLPAGAVDYIEAHGTGTPLGDPIEMDSLNRVYGKVHTPEHPFTVSSVKANIGHLESAAGIASIIKTVGVLQHKYFPPQVNFNTPNPEIPWDRIPVRLRKSGTHWESETVRTAGVSSFGFSGTNAHLIMQEAPERDSAENVDDRDQHLLVLSAKTPEALSDLVSRYYEYLEHTEHAIGDICYTAAVGRTHLPYRIALLAESKSGLVERLGTYLSRTNSNKPIPQLYTGNNTVNQTVTPVFLFTGQGSQYQGMGKELYATQPVFKAAIDNCNEYLSSLLEIPLLSVLYGDDDTLIHGAIYTQVSIFSVEYALAQLWLSWGIKPAAVMGHSIGEYVAACVAGIFSLEDGLKLVAGRGRLVQSLPDDGGMAAVIAKEEIVSGLLSLYEGRVAIAAINAPENIVISGEKDAINDILLDCKQQNIPARMLQISHALHSPLVDSILPEFRQLASEVQFHAPSIPIVSNASGELGGSEMAQPEYWAQHMRNKVQFERSLNTLDKMGCNVFVEVGGTSTLISLGMQCIPQNDGLWLRSLGMNNMLFNMSPKRLKGQSDWQPLLESLAQWYVQGYNVDWQGFEQPYQRTKVILPNYPFQRTSHWLEPVYGERNKSMGESIETTQQEIVPPTSTVEKVQVSKHSDLETGLQRSDVLDNLHELIMQVSGFELRDTDLDTSLLELGLDSLMLTRLMHALVRQYELEFEISWFFQKTDTVDKITDYVTEHGKLTGDSLIAEIVGQTIESPSSALPLELLEEESIVTDDNRPKTIVSDQPPHSYQHVIDQQLQLMGQQLALLQTGTISQPPMADESNLTNEIVKRKSENTLDESNRPHLRAMRFDREDLSELQQQFVNTFCARYIQRTERSKAHVIKHRAVHVDWINSLNFRPLLKDITYPIVHERSEGARIWDIDGNEYINIGMGYGVSFFGMNPPFIKQVLHEQIDKGYELGPQCDVAGDVAQLVHELTGVERVAFCNTGSEAVMVALRIARTVTERRKVVQFAGSYHGSFDGVLAETTEVGTLPTTPGTVLGMVEDVIVLNYDTEAALETIREHAHELAAVLVEPVQSRKPGLQPKAFLQELRKITEASGTALIFDEVLTGFRIHPGGCQHHFGVTADIVTYGKIIGGGMPMAAVAGKAKFLNAVDGGYWEYDDDSYPASNMTVFAGTFCKHPLSMRAAKACLEYMQEQGAELQEGVNYRTAYFVNTLNAFFKEQSVAIKIHYFSSVFRFESFGKYSLVTLPIEMELLFQLLLEKGVYTWERRICFFSMAISDEDVERLIDAVKNSVFELRRGGFLLESKPLTATQLAAFSLTPAIQTFAQSSVQRRLFVLSDIDGDSNGYRMSQAFSITGSISHPRIQRCLDELVTRHALFRTAFTTTDDGELIQTVHAQARCVLQKVDSSSETLESDIEAFDKPFDLAQAPVFRVVLFHVSDQQQVMVFYSHHIVFDGLSWNIFIREFNHLYGGGSLPAETRSYTDYIPWQTEWLKSEKAYAGQQYWLERFAELPPALMLPNDFPRPQQRKPLGGIVFDVLDEEVTHGLKNLARQQGITLNMLLMAVYTILLHKLSHQDDFVIGIPTSGRPLEGFEDVLGMFANTMPMRNQIQSDHSFSEFLQVLKGQASSDYDHQDYPFENLVEKLDLVRDPSRNALFDTMFVYEQADERRFNLDGAELRPFDLQKRTALFDLVLEVIEQGGVLQLHLEYSTQLFRPATIQRWMSYFKVLAQALITDPEQINTPLYDLPYLPENEIKQLTKTFNDTSVEYPDSTLTELFESQVRHTPDRVAVYCESREMCYRVLNSLANQIAHTLLAKESVVSNTPVVLFVARSEMMIAGMLGILKAGGAYVPLEVAYPDERISYIIKDSGASIVLTETDQQKRLQGILQLAGLSNVQVVNADQVDAETSNPVSNITSASLAYILYTSGSTGQPKGVLLEHGMITNMLHWRMRVYEMHEDDVVLQLASYASDSAVEEIFPQLISGGSTVLFPPERLLDAAYLAGLVEQHKITDLIPTPSFYKVFLEGSESDLSSLKHVILMGEAIESDVVKLHFKALPDVRLFNAYGPTENSVNSSLSELFPTDETVLIGKPIDNSTAYILGNHQEVLATGVPGEICLGGKGVARGYLNRVEQTAEKFVENPFAAGKMYLSGDLGCWMPDGNLKFLGRIDDQVQIRGNRVEPGEVENRLVKFDQVKDGVIVPQQINGSMNLVAYVVAAEGLKIPELREYLDRHLPAFMVPAYFVMLKALPFNSRGKLDKKQLPLPSLSQHTSANSEYVEPEGEREILVAKLWSEVLKQATIGKNDDYFSLGGDSIKAIQIISRLRQAGFSLKTRDIFSYPTVAGLAPRLQLATHQAEQGMIAGAVPLTAIQHWFFEHFSAAHQSHYTQAIQLQARDGFDETIIQEVLRSLYQHHDVLRVVYRDEQLVHDNQQALDFSVTDIVEAEFGAEIDNHIAQLHSNMDFKRGSLFKASLLRGATADCLILVCHHLLIDAVSWRVLLEDFSAAYEQLLTSRELELPLKTDAFKNWADAIQTYAKSPELLAEQTYWETLATNAGQPLIAKEHGIFADVASVEKCLSTEDTRLLLTDAHRAYNTQVNDLLLTALAAALQQWHGGLHTVVALEGHGREDLSPSALDVSRTVGWFTNEYPVWLSIDQEDNVGKQLVNMKESLRSVPSNGIGYGVLRYINGLEIPVEALVGFNYLGQFEEMKNDLFEVTAVEGGACVHSNAKRPHALDIEAIVLEGQLHLRLDYNHQDYIAEDMSTLLESCCEHLQKLLAHCCQRKVTKLTPADLTYSGLSVDDLDDIFA